MKFICYCSSAPLLRQALAKLFPLRGDVNTLTDTHTLTESTAAECSQEPPDHRVRGRLMFLLPCQHVARSQVLVRNKARGPWTPLKKFVNLCIPDNLHKAIKVVEALQTPPSNMQ